MAGDGLPRLYTRKLYAVKDGVARLTQLSRVARVEVTRDGGLTWEPYHRGYANRDEVEGGEWTLTVGDTTRQEQQTQLFDTLPTLDPSTLTHPLPMPKPRVGLILGGPIAEDEDYGKFAGIEDFGPCRFQVDEQHSDQGLSGDVRVLRLKFKSGYLRPWYDKPRTKFQEDEWNTVNGAVQPYFAPDSERFRSPAGATVNYFGWFPDLVASLTPAGGGTVLEATPIARPVRFVGAGTIGADKTKPVGEYDALVGNDSTIYLYWGSQPWPGIGAQFDVTLFSRRISDDNPVLLAGHPVDLVAYALELAGVPVDAASRILCKAALGAGLWHEGRYSKLKLTDFVGKLCGFFRFLVRVDLATGRRQFVPIGPRPASSFTVTHDDRVSASDDGESQPTVWSVAEDSVVNVVTFETQRFRRYVYKTDSGDVPVHMIASNTATLEGARGDTSVNGDRTVTFTLPGQVMQRAADGSTALVDQAYFEDVGGVLVDFAGWGVPQTTVLLDPDCAAASAQLGDEGVLDLPDLPTPFVGHSPLTARGLTTRVVRVVKRTPQIGAIEYVYAHAGELSQTTVDAPETGGSNDPGTPLDPTLSLAASSATPATVATVTLTNGADLSTDNLRTELEYLAQTATPDPTDEGTAFGPVTLYPAGDATTIDTPAVEPGATVWVRARSVNTTSGVASDWTAWDSVDLDAAVAGSVDGTTTIPAPTLVPHLVTGNLSVDVTHPTAATVKVAASTSGPVPAATVRAASPTTLVSGAATVATGVAVAAGDTVWAAAFAYDAVGNESQLGTTVYTAAPGAGEDMATQAELDAVAADLDARLDALIDFTTAPLVLFAADARFPAARRLVAGTNITFDLSVAGQLRINAAGGGGAVETGVLRSPDGSPLRSTDTSPLVPTP